MSAIPNYVLLKDWTIKEAWVPDATLVLFKVDSDYLIARAEDVETVKNCYMARKEYEQLKKEGPTED